MLAVLSQMPVDCLKDAFEQCLIVLLATSVLPLQVAQSMAQEWAIFKVGTADMVPGASDAWAYVLKGRVSTDQQPSEFEQLAMQRSCLLVVEVRVQPPADIQPGLVACARARPCFCTALTVCKHKCLQSNALNM